MSHFKTIASGFVIGVANIIPGVSGGTMALMLGVYERILDAVAKLSSSGIAELWTVVKTTFRLKKVDVDSVKRWLQNYDIYFLVSLGVGGLGAIALTSKLMSWLLENYHESTFGFFVGVVIASLWVPWSTIKNRKRLFVLVLMTVGTLISAGLPLLRTPEDRIAAIEKKIAMKSTAAISADHSNKRAHESAASHSIGDLVLLFGAAALAISAMVLPGVSGSFLLLVLGVYFSLLEAVISLDLFVLSIFSFGCVVGLVVFTKFMNYALKHWHDETFSLLFGLMLGSLFVIWPFQNFTMVGGRRVDLNAVLPSDSTLWLPVVVTFALGFGCVCLFYFFDVKKVRAK